jgi:hypothetical protein
MICNATINTVYEKNLRMLVDKGGIFWLNSEGQPMRKRIGIIGSS